MYTFENKREIWNFQSSESLMSCVKSVSKASISVKAGRQAGQGWY